MNLVAPLYLAALAALALPWLLHRFSDASPERRPFPSTRFLEPTTPPVSRRRTLRYRALLALRMLALIALCLLFAEPWLPRPASLVDARALHVIAVDTSLSMRAGTRFERALEAARERVAAVPEGDPIRVLGFDREVVSLGEEDGAGGASAARAALDALEPGFAASDYGRLMQRFDRLAEESPLPLRATLISDVQRSALPERRNTLYAPRLAALDIVDVGADEANLSLAARARSEDGAQARVEVTVLASGSGAAGDAALERTVVLAHEGEVLARSSLSLSPGERESVVFERITLPERLEPRLDVAFERSDALPEDDRVRVTVPLGGARRVALGALGARVSPATRVFAITALEAEGGASVDASPLLAGQLPGDERRLVVFTPLAADEPLPAELTRFVARGGSALIVDAPGRAGEGREASRAADAVFPRPEPAGESESLRGSGVGRVDESHPLALGDIDWGAVRFFSLGDYEPGEGERVLIETDDRRPVLVERPSESGLALVFNERLDGEDSNLPFQPAFVTLMRGVLDWFDTGRAVPERAAVGDVVALPVNVQVLDPAGEARVPFADAAGAQTFRPDGPGVYTVVSALGEQTLNVLLDPRESDLAPIDGEELRDWRTRHGAPPGETEAAAAGEDGAAPAADEEADASRAEALPAPAAGSARERAERLALWPLLLPLLAVLLLAETLFANRRLDVRREGT